MRALGLIDRMALGIGFAVDLLVLGVGLAIVGTNPSDAEMHLIFWPAFIAGASVALAVMNRNYRGGTGD
jgi:hypothetical protein